MRKAEKLVVISMVAILAATAGFGYALLGKKWFTTAQFYINDANFPTTIAKADGLKAIQNGVSGWGSSYASYAGTSTRNTAVDNVNVITFKRLRNGVLAQTYTGRYDSAQFQTCNGVKQYRFMDTDMEFNNTRVDWTAPGLSCSYEYDMNGVTVHEIGHALGLGHTSVAGATMYPSVSACNFSIGSTEADDKAGLAKIYTGCN